MWPLSIDNILCILMKINMSRMRFNYFSFIFMLFKMGDGRTNVYLYEKKEGTMHTLYKNIEIMNDIDWN